MTTHQEVQSWIEEQTQAYNQMMEISRQQGSEQKLDSRELIEMVTHKAQIMETVERIEQQMAPIKKRWAEFLEEVPEPNREPIRQAMKTLRETLGKLVELETGQQARLQQDMNVLSEQIQHTIQGQKAGKAYESKPSSSPSRFMDRKG